MDTFATCVAAGCAAGLATAGLVWSEDAKILELDSQPPSAKLAEAINTASVIGFPKRFAAAESMVVTMTSPFE